MDASLIMAKFWGGFGLVMSLAFLFRPSLLNSVLKDLDHESGVGFDAAYLTLVIGVASLAIYGKWTFDWRVIITIFGWLSILKGVRILVFPNFLQDFGNTKAIKLFRPIIAIYAILSAFLLFKGLSL